MRLAYAGSRDGKRHLLITSVDGSDAEQRLWTTVDEHLHVNGWRSDGKVLYFMRVSGTGDDVWAYSFAEKTATPFLHTTANESGAAPSPDGRWVAYVSDESGQHEVYLAPANGAGKAKVSRDGGVEPVWSRDAKELFFKNTEGTELLVVAIAHTSEPHVGAPRPVLRQSFAGGSRDPAYAVSPDGKRFLIIRRNQDAAAGIDVTLNWFDELKRLVPAGAPR
jgi:serine/threonine-protein kinase